jgi:uncharacterized membrane protein
VPTIGWKDLVAKDVVAMFVVRHAGATGAFLGWVLPLLLLVALVAVAVYALEQTISADGPGLGFGPAGSYGRSAVSFGSDPAMEQARVRYARGEMGRDDYLRLLDDLRAAPSTGAEAPASSAASDACDSVSVPDSV